MLLYYVLVCDFVFQIQMTFHMLSIRDIAYMDVQLCVNEGYLDLDGCRYGCGVCGDRTCNYLIKLSWSMCAALRLEAWSTCARL